VTHSGTERPYHREAVERVIGEMHDRFGEPMSLRELADVACFSPYHFHRVFTAMTGVTPARFLAAIRLQEAKKLLVTGDRSITDICMSVGYSSLGTFSSRFHALVGVAPNDLRRLARDPALVGQVASALSDGPFDGGGDGTVSVHGEVHAHVDPGAVFVGLFPTWSAAREPEACTVLAGPGRFTMAPVPRGRYHVLATSFPLVADPVDLLLPDRDAVLVGGHRSPLRLTGGAAFVRLRLRPPALTDPPPLLAMPALLATKAAASGEAPVDRDGDRRPQVCAAVG
jgi:AraC-like DNA-binding protein